MSALATWPAGAQTGDRAGFNVRGAVVVWAADADGTAPMVSDFVIDTGAGSADADLIDGDVRTVVTGTLTPTADSNSSADVPSRLFTIESIPGRSGALSTDTNGNGQTDSGDSFARFRLDRRTNPGLANSLTYTSFYVASNTAFNIDAQALRVVGRDDWVLEKIFWDMQVTVAGDDGIAFGAAAQFPHTGGASGGVSTIASLFDMRTRRTVFTGSRKTAATRGTLTEQSVRFDVLYTLGSWSGYDLSTGPNRLEDGIYQVEAEVVYTVWVP